MSEYVNQRELRAVGMSRSGNHAVIQWILSQLQGRYCFLNAVQANYNPFLTSQPTTSPDGERAAVNYPGFNLQREQSGRLSRKDWLIYSHEDEFLGRVGSENFERYHDAFVGPSRVRLDVLILRDPFNLFASRLRSGYGWASPPVAMRMWKQHAREFLGRSRYLRHGPVLISYNRWASSSEYRRGLAHALGLQFTDDAAETVAPCAGGSSFDGLSFQGQASKMKVLSRWRSCIDDPAYAALFDRETFDLCEQAFGPIPGTEILAAAPGLNRAI